MKAMILAAGRGERMRPLTDDLPKPLLKVAGLPLIEHHIKALYRAGIRDIVVNHAWLGHKIEEYVGNGHQFGVNIQYSPESTALETAGGIHHALPLLGNEPFLVINADIWTDYPLIQIVEAAKSRLSQLIWAHLVFVPNPAHHPLGDFHLLEGNPLVFEKAVYPDLPCNTYSGIGLYHPKIFYFLDEEPLALGPVLKNLIQEQHVTAEIYDGDWFDIGTPQRLDEINAYLAEKLP